MTGKFSYPYNTAVAELPGNCKVTYIDEGVGERTLLFIHGLANYALVWRKNIDYLKKYYRCIAIDLPGNGLSDQNEHKFTMQFFGQVVADFIEQLELKHVCLVGHSMGGQVAMTAALAYPQCAETIVLCAPAGFESFSVMEKTMYYSSMRMLDFISTDEQNLKSTIESSFYRHQREADSMVKELVGLMHNYKLSYYKRMVEASIRSMLEEPVLNRLPQIQQPTLVMFGRNDALIPNKLLHHTHTEQLAKDAIKKMPDAVLQMIPDCGHFVQWEKADEVNRNIIMFLERDR